MGCGNCSSEGGLPKGCKNNGACGVSGCNKLEVFDWLADVALPAGATPYDLLEVRFKNSRKGFYRNKAGDRLQVGDVVVVDTSPGFDVGVVSVAGELARIQVRKKAPNLKAGEAKNILRKAKSEDIEKWKNVRETESKAMFTSRELANRLGLKMKISDVEYQGDGSKATFYYTSEDRVDFRQLIKDMADTFKVRIEMKQIGMRQESARLGGIGSCGRELCCSTWLTDFRSVSTASARYQQLSLNPQKLAGQCGKLKCCLNYELDSYVEALKRFPSADIKLKTEKGVAYHVKTDVFKDQMWYVMKEQDSHESDNFIPLSPERVKEIIALNKEDKFPADLRAFVAVKKAPPVALPEYNNVVGQDSVNRFEHVFKKNKNQGKRRPKSKGANSQNQGAKKQGDQKRPPNPQARQQGKSNPEQQGQQKTGSNQRRRNRNNRNRGRGNKPQDKPAV